MSKRVYLLNLFKDIADAIRAKTGQTRLYEIDELPDRIMDISTGATTPTQAKSVELVANGTESVVPDAGYLLSKVDIKVNVPQNNRNNAYFEYKGEQLIKSLKSIDLSSFNTSNVTSMSYMFGSCYALTSLDLSSFNTSNVTSMSYMFGSCYVLTSLDLSNFNTSNVTSMDYMFGSCYALTSLDLSSFNISNVKSMNYMFGSCKSLTSLTLGANWAPNEKVTSLSLSDSLNLTHDSCLDVLNKLATRTNSPTLKLHANTKALLTADEIKIATDKGWVVS